MFEFNIFNCNGIKKTSDFNPEGVLDRKETFIK